MKALVYEGPRTLVLRDVAAPELHDNEVLVEPLWNGICGSDLHAFQHATPRRRPPMIMGHEFSGRIVDSRGDSAGLQPGQLVVVRPVRWCGACHFCRSGRENLCPERKVIGVNRSGSYAERIAVDAEQCLPVPAGLDPKIAALAEPAAVALHALGRAECIAGKEIVILGAGVIGLMAVLAARSLKADKITAIDLRPKSLNYAASFGADTCINGAERDAVATVRQASGGRGSPVVLEAVGREQTIRQAIAMAEPGGMVVLMGMGPQVVNLDALDIVAREVHLCGTYASGKDFDDAIPLLQSFPREFGSLIGPVWPLEQGVQAFEDYDANLPERFKVMISK